MVYGSNLVNGAIFQELGDVRSISSCILSISGQYNVFQLIAFLDFETTFCRSSGKVLAAIYKNMQEPYQEFYFFSTLS